MAPPRSAGAARGPRAGRRQYPSRRSGLRLSSGEGSSEARGGAKPLPRRLALGRTQLVAGVDPDLGETANLDLPNPFAR